VNSVFVHIENARKMYANSFTVLLVLAYASQSLALPSQSGLSSESDEHTADISTQQGGTLQNAKSSFSSMPSEFLKSSMNLAESGFNSVQDSVKSMPQQFAKQSMNRVQGGLDDVQNSKLTSLPQNLGKPLMHRAQQSTRGLQDSVMSSLPLHNAGNSMNHVPKPGNGIRSTTNQTPNHLHPGHRCTGSPFAFLKKMPMETEQDIQNLFREFEGVADKMYEQEIRDLQSWSQSDVLSQYQSKAEEALTIARDQLKKAAQEALSQAENSISEAKETMSPEQLREYINQQRQVIEVEMASEVQYFLDAFAAIRGLSNDMGVMGSNLVTNSLPMAKSLPEKAFSGMSGASISV
jgi:hypothetical protein